MKNKNVIILLILLVVVLVVILLSGGGDDKTKEQQNEVPLELITEQEVVPVVEKSQASKQQEEVLAREKLKSLEASLSKPSTYSEVLNIALNAPSIVVRQEAEKLLLKILVNNGQIKTQGQIRNWLKKFKKEELPPRYETVLRALDPTTDIEDRLKGLNGVFDEDREFILRLTVSSAFDSGKFDEYQEVVAIMTGDLLKEEGLHKYSLLALVLANQTLAYTFVDAIQENIKELKDDDIFWILPILAKRNDVNTRAVADLALKRRLLSNLKMSYLRFVRDRDDIPSDVLATLISAAAGTLKPRELSSLGSWMDLDAEQILLAILADSSDKEVALSAFDMLAAKNLTSEPASSLFSWIKEKHWDKRLAIAQPVGVLSVGALSTDEDIVKAIGSFDLLDDASAQLFTIFSEAGNSKVMVLLVNTYKDAITLNKKLSLLNHRNKDVRLVAVRSIKTNNIIASKIILEKYYTERNGEVKQAYHEQFPELFEGR